MGLTITTDHDEITAALDAFLAADPVGGTLLGTIRQALEDTAWAAIDGDRVAARSGAAWPVSVAGDWPAEARVELAARLRDVPSLRGLTGALPVIDALLGDLDGVRVALRMGQGLFRCDELAPPRGVAGAAVAATENERRLVRDWYAAFADEAHEIGPRSDAPADRLLAEGTCWLWRDDTSAVVSLAARRRAIAGSARVGPVYTPPTERGRGYGSAVTAAATRDILAEGAIPVLFTDLSNPTSNKIYQQLGYRLVEQRRLIMFA